MSGKYVYIDLEYINELSDGEPEFLIQIIGAYLSSIPPNLDKLRESAAAADYREVGFCCHKLKGSFHFIGCYQLTGPISQIEEYANSNTETEKIPALVEQVNQVAIEITKELRQVLHDAEASL